MAAFEGQRVNWPQPRLPVTGVKTYALVQPAVDPMRPASCQEVGCLSWRNGWVSHIDASTERGRLQAEYIRRRSGRSFTEEADGDSGRVAFRFDPGQQCFRAGEHRVRKTLYVVRDGDFRGNPTGQRREHDRPEHWVEDFAEHQQGLADRLNQG